MFILSDQHNPRPEALEGRNPEKHPRPEVLEGRNTEHHPRPEALEGRNTEHHPRPVSFLVVVPAIMGRRNRSGETNEIENFANLSYFQHHSKSRRLELSASLRNTRMKC